MKLRSAIVFFSCLFLAYAPAKSYGISADNALSMQKESRLISSGLSTAEDGITPSPVPTVENIPVQLRSPFPLRKFTTLHSLYIHLSEHVHLWHSRFSQAVVCYKSLPIYISICLLLI